jgi:hypothetical protein
MRRAFATFAALLASSAAAALVLATPATAKEFFGRDSVNEWIDQYRRKPQPQRLPEAIRILSKSLAFKDPEAAGIYVGFIAGVIGAEPARAEALIRRTLPLPPGDQWVVVRAIAYSGLPHWRQLLGDVAPRLPARSEMIADYLSGRLPTLDAIALDQSPTFLERLKLSFSNATPAPKTTFVSNPELLDTLWGQYFATGSEAPVRRILTVLPWSKERDSVERLTVGNLAKVTLANNASRYPELLAMLRTMKPHQPEAAAKVLADVIAAAETADGPRLRKEALAAIEEIRRKGPGSKREIALWGQIGQGALALGCIAAAAASLTTLGLPCVVGGAVVSAGLYYYTAQ